MASSPIIDRPAAAIAALQAAIQAEKALGQRYNAENLAAALAKKEAAKSALNQAGVDPDLVWKMLI